MNSLKSRTGIFILIILSLFIIDNGFSQPGPNQGPPPGYGQTEEMETLGGGGGTGSLIQVNGKIIGNITGNFDGQFNSMNVGDVFKLIAQQKNLNILVSPKVNATLTANFKNVSIKDAFLAILSANNLFYLEQGEIIKILTMPEYKQELLKSHLETRSYDTSVIDLKNLVTIVKPFLTPGIGSVNVDQQSSKILITDIKDNFDRIENLIKEISALPKMIEIQAKIIEVDLNDDTALGVNWNALQIGNAVNIKMNPTPADGVVNESLNVNATHTFAPSAASLDLMISLMQSEMDARVISQPTVMAMNRQEAKILIGGKVPYISKTSTTTTASVTDSAIEFAEVGLKILITPMVTPDGKIKMKIFVSQSTSTLINVSTDRTAPDISTSEVECEAVSSDGTPIVIGGLIKTTKTKNQQSIPILGKIPVLKYLFSYTSDAVKREELVIILTPTIVKTGESNLRPEEHTSAVQEELKAKIK